MILLEEVDPLELIMQLTDRIDEINLNISILKEKVNAGTLKLREFEEKRKIAENEKDDLKKRIFYIKKGISEKKRKILDEFNLLVDKFQLQYDNKAIFRVSVFFHYSTDKFYEVKVDFGGYPRLPKIEILPEMEKMIGGLNELKTISNYKISNPLHVKDILDEISDKMERVKNIHEELDKIKGNFVVEDTEFEYKIRVILWSMGEEYPLMIEMRDFPNLPSIKPSPRLMKYVNIQDLESIKNWKRKDASVLKILNEISFILDRKYRLELELNNLKEAGFVTSYGFASQTIKLQLAATVKSPQAIFSIKIPPNYPTSPPDVTLTNSLNDIELENEINGFINDAITYHEINLTDLFTEIKQLLISRSKEVCSYCKRLKCPICDKDLVGKIEGVTGEYECNTRCPNCGSQFHVCCWKEISANRQECSVCGAHIRIF